MSRCVTIQCFTQRETAILGRVVIVDLQIALAREHHVEARVAAQGVEQMVQESDARLDGALAAAVEVECHANRRLAGRAVHAGGARAHERSSSKSVS